MTIKEIVSELELKVMCMADYEKDTISMASGIDVVDDLVRVVTDKTLVESAINCLRRTYLFFDDD